MAVSVEASTAETLLRLPRGNWRYELLRGELLRMSPAGHVHGRIAARFTARLAPFVEEEGLGEVFAAKTGFLLRRAPDTVLAPDVAFVTALRMRAVPADAEGFFPGAPDLVVEVASPSDAAPRVEQKIADWLAAGTQVVIIVEPAGKRVVIRRNVGNEQVFGLAATLTVPELLPGWSLRVDQLFR